MAKDPFTFTNFFVPLRLHLETKDEIMKIVSRIKPDHGFYYGAILAEKTVVALIKNDPKITVIPAGNLQLL